jgi:hypothetical protein
VRRRARPVSASLQSAAAVRSTLRACRLRCAMQCPCRNASPSASCAASARPLCARVKVMVLGVAWGLSARG